MDVQPLDDVIVVVPGILGSALADSRGMVWGSKRTLHHLLSLGHRLHPRHRLESVSLIGDWSAIPGFWKIDGYGLLLDFLRSRFAVDDSNLVAFPYDWRQSNQQSGERLARVACEALERRRAEGHSDAKLVLICHSMGGLVARWYLDVLGGAAHTRRLITIGTPYRGSVKALGCLVNGIAPWSGRVGAQLTAVARASPAVYELLPTYRSVVSADDRLVRLSDSEATEHLDQDLYGPAQEFHRRLATAVAEREGKPPPYAVHAVITSLQPTAQFVRARGDKLELLMTFGGQDHRGDGTVPRQAMAPPEWVDDSLASVGPGETHAHLQNSRVTHNQLWSILTAEPWRDMAPPLQLSLAASEVVKPGGTLSIDVSTSENGLTLVATLENEDHETLMQRQLANTGNGAYQMEVRDALPSGMHRLTVTGPPGVEPVSDVVTVWPTLSPADEPLSG